MRKGQGIAGPPPQVGPMTARQQQRQQYLNTHPNAGQRPQQTQGQPPMQQRPQMPQRPPQPPASINQAPNAMQQMKSPGGMALQPMPQGQFGPAQPMPRGGQGFGLSANGFDPNAGWQNPYGRAQGQKFPQWNQGADAPEGSPMAPQSFGGGGGGAAPQFHDMMYRYPQGQGPNMNLRGGIQNTMYNASGQSPQMGQWGQGGASQFSPEQMQQMYNQKVGSRGGY